jgi:imidazolonepropionase-like amidohydrolase
VGGQFIVSAEKTSKITVVKAGRLIDGNGGSAIKDAVIIVTDRRIHAIGRASETTIPSGADVLDATQFTVVPGLFDTHMHLAAWNCSTFSNYRAALFEVSNQLESFYMLFHAQMCFEMGFTTIRDLGKNTPRGDFVTEACAVRDAINAGIAPGPRLLVSGRAIITGSHLDLTLPRNALRPAGMTADGPWDLRRVTRECLRAGCDWIKTSASGGGGTADEEPSVRNMTQEELDAIVDEAHAFHKHVAVHCFTTESHRMCVKAGVDTIEHIVFTNDQTIAMIKEAGIPVVPTLSHRTDHAIEVRRRIGTPENVLKKMKQIQPSTFDSFKKMHQAGIKLAMGTDTGLDPEMGTSAGELEVYVRLGMTPMEALQTATKNAAEALRLDKDLGTLEVGKLADMVIVDGDPSRDITVLQDRNNIKAVMKEGHAYIDKISDKKRYVMHPEPGSWKIIDNL